MGTGALSITMREAVLNSVIKDRFGKQVSEAYKDVVSKVNTIVAEAHAKFDWHGSEAFMGYMRWDNSLDVRSIYSGRCYSWKPDGDEEPYKKICTLFGFHLSSSIVLSKLYPVILSTGSLVLSDGSRKKIKELYKSFFALLDSVLKVQDEVHAVLFAVSTVKQAIDLLPEIERYLPTPSNKVGALVPIAQVNRVRAMLQLMEAKAV